MVVIQVTNYTNLPRSIDSGFLVGPYINQSHNIQHVLGIYIYLVSFCKGIVDDS